MARVIIRPKARRNLNRILVYFIETAGLEIAKRFRKAATETFLELTKSPFVGVPRKVRAELTEVRHDRSLTVAAQKGADDFTALSRRNERAGSPVGSRARIGTWMTLRSTSRGLR